LPEVICNTSPLRYLHQLGLLHVLPALVKTVVVPPAVVAELAAGRALGVDVPDVASLDWVSVRTPLSVSALPLIHDLGAGETEVLMLALESEDAIAVLDDALARRTAESLRKPVKGTIGILLDAKKAGLIDSLCLQLDRLQSLRFHLAPHTRAAALELAGE